jgi:hypothetical protein
MRGFFHVAFSAFLFIGLSACKEDAGSLTLPNDLDKEYSLVFSDTTKLITSTVLLDSFPTSNASTLLLGKYTDEFFGSIEAQPFMEFQMQSSKWEPSLTAKLDSMKLFLKYAGYYYGDTSVAQSFEVYRMSEDFVSYRVDEFLQQEFKYPTYDFLRYFLFAYPNQYNTTTFSTEPSPIGSFTIKPRPNSVDLKDEHFEIALKLDNTLAEKMLMEAKNTGGAFSSQSRFSQYFNGLTIKNVSGSGAVFGLQADSVVGGSKYSRAKIKLYYKEGVNRKIFTFPIYLGLNNFNHITADRSGTPLENLESTNREIPSSLTDGQTFIQSGTGIFTKVRFPHLKSILNLPGFLKLNSAKLVLVPAEKTYSAKNFLPASLVLFEGDSRNIPYRLLPADYDSRNYQKASVQISPIDNHIVGYTFSVTQYVQSLLDAQTDTRNLAMFLSMPDDQWNGTVNRAVINTSELSNYRLRLEIYYLRRNE